MFAVRVHWLLVGALVLPFTCSPVFASPSAHEHDPSMASALALDGSRSDDLTRPLLAMRPRLSATTLTRGNTDWTSFTRFLLFTTIYTSPDGSAIWFTSNAHFDGPVHTNGEFRFAYQPYFGDEVSSVNGKAWFYNDGNPIELAADHNGSIDVPQFARGFERGAPVVTLPENPYAQQNVALGLPGLPTQPTNTQIRQVLGLSGSTTTPPSGVYLPHSGSTLTGGIYVQGNLDRCLMYVDASDNQVYVLTQGTWTDTVRVNLSTGMTSFFDQSAGVTALYVGKMPDILFTNGVVGDLRGPDRVGGAPPPALARETQLLIVSTSDIVVQRDITCQDHDTAENVLGLFSSGGSVRVGTGAPDDMNLDAFVMAASPDGAFQVDNYDSGSPRGTFHLRGGSSTMYYGNFFTFDQQGQLQTGYARDFHYDRRGLVPPYYPTAPLGNTAVPDHPALPTAVRLSIPRPNPSRGSMRVDYSLPRPGRVRLTLFDVLGRRVARLLEADQSAGEHVVAWDGGRGAGRRVAPGIYLLELESAGERTHVRIVILE